MGQLLGTLDSTQGVSSDSSSASNAQDASGNRLRAFDLQIHSDAALPGNAHSVSDAELIIDALSAYQLKLIDKLKETVANASSDPRGLEDWRVYFAEGEFAADLHSIQQLGTYVTLIAADNAATLRLIFGDNPKHSQQ